MGYLDTKICLMKYNGNSIEIINNKCLIGLGGRKIDDILIDEYINKINKLKDINIEKNKDIYLQIKSEIIILKKKLNKDENTELNLKITIEDENIEIPFNNSTFNEILEKNEINNEVINGIKSLINESNINDNDKKHLSCVITGGCLKIKYLQEQISLYFDNIENNNELIKLSNMEYNVCLGNSYYGLIKSNKWKFIIKDEDNILIKCNELSTRLGEYKNIDPLINIYNHINLVNYYLKHNMSEFCLLHINKLYEIVNWEIKMVMKFVGCDCSNDDYSDRFDEDDSDGSSNYESQYINMYKNIYNID